MKTNYPELFKPFKINKLEIKNRIVMAPMLPLGWLDEDKNLTEDTIAYYTERAKGGAGLIMTGASFTDAKIEFMDFTRSPFAKPNTFLIQTRKLVESVHRYGCKVFVQMQLGCGRTSVPAFQEGLPVAPSKVANRYAPDIECREMTTEEVYDLINATVNAVALCQAAGADGVNINGVKGGYLGDQFAIEAFNKRTDEFGGDIDGRIRLMVKIIEGVRAACGPDFPVTTRIGTKSHMKAERVGHLPGEEYTEYGRDMEESLIVAKKLEEAGYDGVLFGTGSYDSIYWLYPPMYMPDGCYIEEASELKKALDIPIMVPGKLSEPEMANEALKNGLIDSLSMGRALLADPYWPTKVRNNEIEDIRPCIYCNNGCIGRVLNGLPMQCAVNPDAFQERYQADKYAKVAKPKKIAIIGGGIAGMEAARVAAIRGHAVTIYEATDRLGGLMIPAEVPAFKDKDRKLLKWFKYQMDKLGVTIKLNEPMTADKILALDADEIIVATGSKARKLPVEGADQAHVISGEAALLDISKVKGKVVLIGGGQVGCETAIWLKQNGIDVTIVENRADLILGSGDPIPQQNRDMLLEMLIFHNIPVYKSTRVTAIKEKSVVINDGAEKELDADTVIVSIGYQPNQDLYNEVYQVADKNVWMIGDAQRPATIMMAIRDGSAIGALV